MKKTSETSPASAGAEFPSSRLEQVRDAYEDALRSLYVIRQHTFDEFTVGEFAAERLLKLSLEVTKSLEACASVQVDQGLRHFENLARRCEEWPVLWHAHKERRDQTLQFLRKLKLSENLGLHHPADGKPFSYATRGNQIVKKLFDEIERYRTRGGFAKVINGNALSVPEQEEFKKWVHDAVKSLPRLRREPVVLAAWKKAANELLPFVYGAEYQDHPDLKNFARSARKRWEPRKRWERRKMIKERLGDAWECIAGIEGE